MTTKLKSDKAATVDLNNPETLHSKGGSLSEAVVCLFIRGNMALRFLKGKITNDGNLMIIFGGGGKQIWYPTEAEIEIMLNEPHWTFKTTPLNIPEILKPLVGKTKYDL